MTRGRFARLVLEKLGAPVTLHNRRALMAQMQTEGGSSRNNPFNTTQKMPGSTNVEGNVAFVQHYTSPQQGIDATVKTLKTPGHRYEAIVSNLRENAYATETIKSIAASDWGTGGTVLTDVLDDIRKGRAPNRLSELEKREIAS